MKPIKQKRISQSEKEKIYLEIKTKSSGICCSWVNVALPTVYAWAISTPCSKGTEKTEKK